MRPHILVIQPEFDKSTPRGIRTYNLMSALSDQYQITVLCFHHFGAARTSDDFQIIRFNYGWRSVLFNPHTTYLGRGRWIRSFLRLLRKTLQQKPFPDPWVWEEGQMLQRFDKLGLDKVDLVIASIFPFSSAGIAGKLCAQMRSRTKIMLDIGDPLFANSADPSSTLDLQKKSYEHAVIERCDKLIVTNHATKQSYVETYGVAQDKIAIVEQGVADFFLDLEPMNLLNGPLRMVYAGAFYKHLRDPQHFLAALKTCTGQSIECRLFAAIDGGSYHRDDIIISVLDRLPQQELTQHYQWANLLLFIDNKTGLQTPGKIFELLALRRPILFIYEDRSSPTFQLVEEMEHVICVENNTDAIRSTLLRLGSAPLQVSYPYDPQTFSWKARAVSFQQAIDTCLRSSSEGMHSTAMKIQGA